MARADAELVRWRLIGAAVWQVHVLPLSSMSTPSLDGPSVSILRGMRPQRRKMHVVSTCMHAASICRIDGRRPFTF